MDLTCCELEIQTKQNMVREDVFHFKFQFFLEEAELHMFFLSTMRLHQTNHKNPTHQKMPPSPERAGFNGWLWSPIFPQSITVVPCCWSHERPKDGILFHGSEGYQCFGISDKENMVAWGMLGLVLPFLYRDHLAYHANPYWPSSLKGWDKFLVCPGGSNAFKPRCVHWRMFLTRTWYTVRKHFWYPDEIDHQVHVREVLLVDGNVLECIMHDVLDATF